MAIWSTSRRATAGPLLRPTAEEDDTDRLEQDDQIEEDGEILDVIEVVLELLQGIGHGTSVGILHLRPAGDAGFDREAERVKGDLLFQLPDEDRALGPRTDKTHLSNQH